MSQTRWSCRSSCRSAIRAVREIADETDERNTNDNVWLEYRLPTELFRQWNISFDKVPESIARTGSDSRLQSVGGPCRFRRIRRSGIWIRYPNSREPVDVAGRICSRSVADIDQGHERRRPDPGTADNRAGGTGSKPRGGLGTGGGCPTASGCGELTRRLQQRRWGLRRHISGGRRTDGTGAWRRSRSSDGHHAARHEPGGNGQGARRQLLQVCSLTTRIAVILDAHAAVRQAGGDRRQNRCSPAWYHRAMARENQSR